MYTSTRSLGVLPWPAHRPRSCGPCLTLTRSNGLEATAYIHASSGTRRELPSPLTARYHYSNCSARTKVTDTIAILHDDRVPAIILDKMATYMLKS